MRKNLKKLLGIALTSALVLGNGGIMTYAADTIDGSQVGTSISTSSDSATATTTYSRPATISSQAFVSFTYGNLFLENGSEQATASIGGVSVTAHISIPGGTVTGGRGEHYVKVASGAELHRTTRTGHSKN